MKVWQKLTYSMGRFANTVSYLVFSNRIQFFYIDVVGLSPAVAGLLWTLFGVWNGINDPLTGQISDRTRSRWGRRIPYLLFGAIPLGILFALLWTPPGGGGWQTAAYFVAILFFFDAAHSLVAMAYNALFSEITTTVEERTTLAALREGAGLLALLIAFILAPILSQELGYPGMGIALGVIIVAGYLTSLIGIRERQGSQTSDLGLVESFRITFRNRPFLIFLLANTMKEFIFIMMAATTPFWAKYVLRIAGPAEVFGVTLGAAQQEAVLLGIPFILAIPTLALWQRVAKRLGPVRSWAAAFLGYLPGMLIITFADSFPMALLGTLLLAPPLAGSMMLPLVVLAGVIDEDNRKTGFSRDGVYFGVAAGVIKLGYMLQGLLYAVVLSGSGFVANVAEQPAAAVAGIRFLMGGTPLLAALAGFFALRALLRTGVSWSGGGARVPEGG